MDIINEITRIQNAKAALKTSIENKGVTVPASTKIDGYPALVDQISGGIQPYVPVEPFIFEGKTAGTVTFKAVGDYTCSIEISRDNGSTWTTITSSTAGTSFNISVGEQIQIRGNNKTYAIYTDVYNNFESTAQIYVYGDIANLLGEEYRFVLTDYCFFGLFFNATNIYNKQNKMIILPFLNLSAYCYSYMFYGCTSLTDAPELPATILTNYCYFNMFWNCTSLISIPATLPATEAMQGCYSYMFGNCTSLITPPAILLTKLKSSSCAHMFQGCTHLTSAPTLSAISLGPTCYSYMFSGCTSLTTAPALPATTLENSCYSYMFNNCTSLKSAPTLSATTLGTMCYAYMFNNCTSLITAPTTLPATTLTNNCYQAMFMGCNKLTTAPILPAITLVSSCYNNMFYNCTKLNYIKAMFTTAPSTTYTNNWVYGVASSGRYVKNSSATYTTTGVSAIPTGWTVQTASS